ncbi:MAG: putative membrane protein YdfJ with MMPL/SSD domain [Akkermansiaceae bacterium]|jgi:uncharacterized membrane protein YdfJ with MMPL/SSD domain
MKKRPWLRWALIGVVLALVGTAVWFQKTVDNQPTEHPVSGLPEVKDLPDPEDVE